MGENCDRFETARKLVQKILVVDHTNNSSLFELTTFDGYSIAGFICEVLISAKFARC